MTNTPKTPAPAEKETCPPGLHAHCDRCLVNLATADLCRSCYDFLRAMEHEGKAEPPPAAESTQQGASDLSVGFAGTPWGEMIDRDAADESGATRDALVDLLYHSRPCDCDRCHDGRDFARDKAKDVLQAKPRPGIEAARGEPTGELADNLAWEIEVLQAKLQAAKERLADNAKEIPALREAAGRYRREKQRVEAEVERLQGELAAAGKLAGELQEQSDHYVLAAAAKQQKIDRLREILRWLDNRGGLGIDVHTHIRAALAPQEGAEKGTKG